MLGDHLVVPLILGTTHHGVDLGDGSVAHWTLLGSAWGALDCLHRAGEFRIERTSLDEFHRGRPVSVRAYQTAFASEVVVRRALSRVGESGYDVLTNNCEHFACWCKTGGHHSEQVQTADRLLELGTQAARHLLRSRPRAT